MSLKMVIMRHGKAQHPEIDISDFERRLKTRGREDALRAGALLKEKGFVPDVAFHSAARRTSETCELVMKAAGADGVRHAEQGLYLASGEAYLQALADKSEAHQAGTVLLVGHNPGLEELVSHLRGQLTPFPTAATAFFTVECSSWAQVHPGIPMTCEELWMPKGG